MLRFRHHSFPSDKDSLFVALEGEGWSYLCLFQYGGTIQGGGGGGEVGGSVDLHCYSYII